jgi:hypothetical protein
MWWAVLWTVETESLPEILNTGYQYGTFTARILQTSNCCNMNSAVQETSHPSNLRVPIFLLMSNEE